MARTAVKMLFSTMTAMVLLAAWVAVAQPGGPGGGPGGGDPPVGVPVDGGALTVLGLGAATGAVALWRRNRKKRT